MSLSVWSNNGTGSEDRVILHCDLNSFFASVELLERPDLKNECVAVGGDKSSRHGIILAKNDNAKRCGVKTGEPVVQAVEKCPKLVILPPHFEKYLHYSKLVRSIYCRYTDLVESFGADECWCDVTQSRLIFGSGRDIAESIRRTVKAETGLTVSIGVSFNKIFAKLGSDMKKPDAITELPRELMAQKIYPLPCGDLFGVGAATEKKLTSYGIHTIGELASQTPAFMKKVFGKVGLVLLENAKGNDTSPVTHKDYVPDFKSISHGCTSAFDLTDHRGAELLILSLSESIAAKLRDYGFAAHCVSLSVRDTSLEYFTFSKKIEEPVISARQICLHADGLLHKNYDFHLPIRAITVAVSSLMRDDEPYQLDMCTDYDRLYRIAKAESAEDEIRRRMGQNAIFRASLMNVNFARSCAIYEYNPFGHNTVK